MYRLVKVSVSPSGSSEPGLQCEVPSVRTAVWMLAYVPDPAVRIADPAARSARVSVGQIRRRALKDILLIEIRIPRGRFGTIEPDLEVCTVTKRLVRRLPAATEVIHFVDLERWSLKPLPGPAFGVAFYSLIG